MPSLVGSEMCIRDRIRTDNPKAEIGLFENNTQVAYETWEAHRELSVTIHKKIEAILHQSSKDWNAIDGIICYKGPGSFTGLRIGLSVGNALAFSLKIPIVSSSGDDWIHSAKQRLQNHENETVALPEYGAEANITQQRK